MVKLRVALLVSFVFCLWSSSFAEERARFPEQSLYNVPIIWTDNTNRKVSLSHWAGESVVITMAYTSCRFSCPLIVRKLKKIEKLLFEAGHKAEFIVITMDPQVDTPEVMAKHMKERGIDQPNWHFLRGNKQDTRKMSLLLEYNFQKTPESIDYMHSNIIHLLNEQGAIAATLAGLNADEQKLLENVGVPSKREINLEKP